MPRPNTTLFTGLPLEPLEPRFLLSAIDSRPQSRPPAAEISRLGNSAHSVAGSGEKAILNAIFGGAGHEFVTLAQREIHNILGVVAGFQTGTVSQYSVPGLAVKVPKLQSGYTGQPHDPLALNAGGALLLKGKKIELAAMCADHSQRIPARHRSPLP